MRLPITLALCLIVTPAIGRAQDSTTLPALDKGELVVAHTVSTTNHFDGSLITSVTLNVWQSGFTEFVRSVPPRVIQTTVPEAAVNALRLDLLEAEILGLQGRLPSPNSAILPFDTLHRVTFVERAPAWMLRFFERHPNLRKRFGAYLRPRVASFSILGFRSQDPRSGRVMGVLDQFLMASFPELFPRPREIIESRTVLSESLSSSLTSPEDLVIRDEEQWCAFQERVNSGSSPPPPCDTSLVDFENEVVIATAIGSRPNTCYSVDITRIEAKPSRRIVEVVVEETAPGTGCGCFLAFVQPTLAVVVDKPIGRVDFVHNVVVDDCQ